MRPPSERAAAMPSKCCSRTCVRRGVLPYNSPAWALPRVGCTPVPPCAGTSVPKRAGSPAWSLHPSTRLPGTETLAPLGRSPLTVVFSSWSQSPESLCRFHGNSLAGGNQFWGLRVPVAGPAPGRPRGRTRGAQALLQHIALAPGLVPGLEQAPTLHRPSHLLLLPFPFLPATGKSRGTRQAVAREPRMSPARLRAQLLGELSGEGDSLEGSRKEQGFFFDCPAREPWKQQ